ncbi:MAG: hypothetical protein P8Y36_06595, partial [Alphaproteobacteria bacterium]
KCARCGHQWRVSPEMPLDEEAGTQDAHQNIVEDEQPAVSSAEASEETTEATQASMPFPPPPPPDAPSDEDPDRNMLSLLEPELWFTSDWTPAQTQQQTLATEQDPAAVEEEPFNEFWEGFAAEREETDLHSDAPAYGDKDMKTVAAEIQSARRNSVIYDAATARDGFADEDEQYAGDADAMADLALQQNMAEALRAAAPQNDEPFGKQGPASYDDDNLHGDEFHYGAEYFDDNTPALRNQLENIEHMPYEAPRQGGGLAAVAAWAVFLSIASGFLLALVNFRGEVVTALPGTAGLYQMVGFGDVGHSIDFSNVSYRWTTSHGKPTVEVTGQVINRTDQTIQVPQLLVNMRDSVNSDLYSTTASIPTRELASQKSADFSIELAVSKNINQIELEFDKVQ